MMFERKLKKIEVFIRDGEYPEALQLVNKTDLEITELEELHLSTKKGEIFRHQGKYEELIELSHIIQKKAQKCENVHFEIYGLLLEMYANYRLNNLRIAHNLIDKTEEILERNKSIENHQLWIRFLAFKAFINTASGNFTKSKEIAELCLEEGVKSENKVLISYVFYVAGCIDMQLGELEEACNKLEKSLEIGKSIITIYDKGYILFSLGYVDRHIGRNDDALEKLQNSLEIRKKTGNKQDISWTLLNLGDVFFAMKEVKKAESYYEQSLINNKETNYLTGIVYSLVRLSMVYKNLSNQNLVLDALEKALDYSEMIEDIDPEFYTLFELIVFFTENKIMNDYLDKYVQKLEKISESSENKIFNQICRLSNALIFKNSNKQKHKQKALELLRDILNENITNSSVIIYTISSYSEMLIEELNKFKIDDSFIDSLSGISQEIKSSTLLEHYSVFAENIINRSILALDISDIKKARELLKLAQFLLDFLKLYGKGSTVYKILYNLYIKERSLAELSEILGITKGALSSHLNYLQKLDMVTISRVEQVRSATLLKHYYRIGDNAIRLFESRDFYPKSSTQDIKEPDQYDIIFRNLIKQRFNTKFLRDISIFIDNYQEILEKEQIAELPTFKSDKGEKEDVSSQKKPLFDLDFNQFFLSKKQYKKYIVIWKEFIQKVNEEVLIKDFCSDEYNMIEKPLLALHLFLPFDELLNQDSK